ncbi:MAG: hypothetical protein IKC98_07715, partial [Firmicutes bacterium]|nr:hypothetical protein [Bacillota bacterium]
MENWWINAYFIGFIVSCVFFLPTFSGVMREQYIWEKTFWTVPYKDKTERASVYAAALLAAFLWPIVWAVTIIVIVVAFLYAC